MVTYRKGPENKSLKVSKASQRVQMCWRDWVNRPASNRKSVTLRLKGEEPPERGEAAVGEPPPRTQSPPGGNDAADSAGVQLPRRFAGAVKLWGRSSNKPLSLKQMHRRITTRCTPFGRKVMLSMKPSNVKLSRQQTHSYLHHGLQPFWLNMHAR